MPPKAKKMGEALATESLVLQEVASSHPQTERREAAPTSPLPVLREIPTTERQDGTAPPVLQTLQKQLQPTRQRGARGKARLTEAPHPGASKKVSTPSRRNYQPIRRSKRRPPPPRRKRAVGESRLEERSQRDGSLTPIVSEEEGGYNSHVEEVRAQNAVIREKDELIRQLQQQLEEKTANQAPPLGSQPGVQDLRHVLDSKRRQRTRDEGSSSSRPTDSHEGRKRRMEDEDDVPEWLNQRIKQAIRQNMEVAGLARDRPNAYDSGELGASPFSQEIKDYTPPEKFSIPRFTLYDGTSDPAAHLRHFIQRMSVWGDVGHLNCKVFSSSLGDLPLRWFCALPAGSISNWRQLMASFLEKFQAHKVIPKMNKDLMAIRMRDDENVTRFAKRFWTTYSQIEDANEELAVMCFQEALLPEPISEESSSDTPQPQ